MTDSSDFSKVRTISKKEIAQAVAVRTGHPVDVTHDVIDLFLNEIVDELSKGNRLEFRRFGIFTPVLRKARPYSRNPRTGEELGPTKPKKWAKFKQSKNL